MNWDASVLVVGLVAIVCFAVALHLSGLIWRVRAAVNESLQAMTILTDKTLDTATRERLLQRSARCLLGQSALIVLLVVLVLATPGAVSALGDLFDIAPLASVLEFLLSWEALIVGTVLLAIIPRPGRNAS